MNSYFNNTIKVKLNKILEKNDISNILLYFTSISDSNCGSINNYIYDDVKNILYINFIQPSDKKCVLFKRSLKYLDYTFNVTDDNNNFMDVHNGMFKVKHVLIVKYIDKNKIEIENVKLLMSLLVENNYIYKVEASCLLGGNVFIVYFVRDIDLNKIKIKLSKLKPIIKEQQLNLYEAYATNSLLIKLNNKNIYNDDADKLYVNLNSKFYKQEQYYWQAPYKIHNSPFYIVKFSQLQHKREFISKIHNNKDEFLIEENYNLQLLNEYLNQNEIKNDEKVVENVMRNTIVIKRRLSEECDNKSDYENENDEKRRRTSPLTPIYRTQIMQVTTMNYAQLPLHQRNQAILPNTSKAALQINEVQSSQNLSSAKSFIKCDLCPFVACRSGLSRHMSHHIETPNSYKCISCPYYAKSSKSINRHYRFTHKTNDTFNSTTMKK